MKLEATLSLDQAAARRWDVTIVGAGPAGAFAARELARGGAAVLLIDKASFPRSKVCGACINGRAMSILRRSGLDASVMCRGTVPLRRFRVYAGRRSEDVALGRRRRNLSSFVRHRPGGIRHRRRCSLFARDASNPGHDDRASAQAA